MAIAERDTRSPAAGGEHGFTIIEVMVAMLVLIVGVLGTVSLVDGANRKTTSTKQREAGTNLARELIDTARAVPYSQLTSSGFQPALAAKPGLADTQPAAGWTVERRGFTYTVEEASVCSIDDPGDGTAATSTAAGFCRNATASAFPDRDPEDLKRVVFRVRWTRDGKTTEVRQSTVIHPGSGGPRITDFRETGRVGNTINFSVSHTPSPARIELFVEGLSKSICADPCTSPKGMSIDTSPLADGRYVVMVQAYDRSDRSAGARALTINLNRTPPGPVTIAGGGWNNDGGTPLGGNPFTELEWAASRDVDVVDYVVYRGGSVVNGRVTGGTAVSCQRVPGPTSCLDPGAFGGGQRPLTYWVVARDTDDSGNLREGTPSRLDMVWPNQPPNPIRNPRVSRSGTVTTVSWDDPRDNGRFQADPDNGDFIDFYRIYRDGQPVIGQRVSREDDGDRAYVDPDNGGTTHTYRITTVDQKWNESTMVSVTG